MPVSACSTALASGGTNGTAASPLDASPSAGDVAAEVALARAALDEACAIDYPNACAGNLRTVACGQLSAGEIPAAAATVGDLLTELRTRGSLSNARLVVDVAALLAHRAEHPAWRSLSATVATLPSSTVLCSAGFDLTPPLRHTEVMPLSIRNALSAVAILVADVRAGAGSAPAAVVTQPDPTQPHAAARRRGDVWEFDFAGRSVSVRTSKGDYDPYVELAATVETGIVIDTPTWRASLDWGARQGFGAEAMVDVNRRAVRFVADVADRWATVPAVINGAIGPRGDGYVVGQQMSNVEATRYHAMQVEAFADAGAAMVTAVTMNHVEEAIGITRAARNADIPVAVSFTVETDGRLPTGQVLGEATFQISPPDTSRCTKRSVGSRWSAVAAAPTTNTSPPSPTHFVERTAGDRLTGEDVTHRWVTSSPNVSDR